MENGTFANVPFFIIFKKKHSFQRRPNALVWSIGLSGIIKIECYFDSSVVCIF